MPTASDLATLVRCPHRIHLDKAGDPAEKLPASEFLQLLWEEGRLHEEKVIATMEVARVSDAESVELRMTESIRLMREGPPLIYHAYLEREQLRGEPDLLERVETSSQLGLHSYIPIDIKSGRAFEDDKGARPKLAYLMQLGAYADLLELHQGLRPQIGRIIDREGTAQTFDLAAIWPTYVSNRTRLGMILSGSESTEPGWKSDCSYCVWQELCWKRLVATDDVTTVAGVGESSRAKLRCVGVNTATDLAGASPALLTSVKGIGGTRASTWTRQAQVQKSGKPLLLRAWNPTLVDFEVSYDVEDFTPDPFVYLHGLLIRGASSRRFGQSGFSEADWGSFRPVHATLPETEEAIWQRFLAAIRDLETQGDYTVYVYSAHEKSTLRHLVEKYGGSAELDSFLSRFVDLLSVVRSTVVFPTDTLGLKAVARFVGFEWRETDPSGAQSLAWWADYEDDPVGRRALLDRIIAYNEDDLRATFALRDWLETFARPQ